MGVISRWKQRQENLKDRKLGKQILKEYAREDLKKSSIGRVSKRISDIQSKIVSNKAIQKKPTYFNQYYTKPKVKGKTYYLPNGQPVDFLTYKRYIANQKQIQNIQLAGQTQRMPNSYIKSPQYEQIPSEMRVWEGGNAMGLDNPIVKPQEGYFQETDLLSGQTKIRKQGKLW